MLKASQLVGFGFGGGFGNDSFTKSLIHFDGVDGAITGVDSARGATAFRIWNAVNNAQLDTAQSKFGGASLLLDGVQDWVGLTNHADFVPTGDYTLDVWIRMNTTAGTQTVVNKPGADGYGPWLFYVSSGSLMFFSSSNGTSWDIANAVTFGTATAGVWTHLAAVRSGNNYYLFQDGALNNSFSNSGTPINEATDVVFGLLYNTSDYNGWIDEFRLSHNARWTAAFTPPTGPYS